MDEEKTIDEEKTVDEAVEEMTGEMKEFEPVAFDEAVKETEPERKDAPILRDAPDPADMNMIHKHVDNFLAKIAGETPIDENVRDSTEYWLKRIAEAGGGGTTVIANPELAGTENQLTGLQVGETKYKVGSNLYEHHIRVQKSSTDRFFFTLVSTSPTELTTEASVVAELVTRGYISATGLATNSSVKRIVVGVNTAGGYIYVTSLSTTDFSITNHVGPDSPTIMDTVKTII